MLPRNPRTLPRIEHPLYHPDFQLTLSLGVDGRRSKNEPGEEGAFIVAGKNGCRCATVKDGGDVWVSMIRSCRPRFHRRVTLGGCPPRVPTDPDVRLRAHPARQSMGLLPTVTSSAIRCRCVDTGPRFEALAVFPSNGSMLRHLLPFPEFPWSEFPGFTGTMRRSDFPTPITPHFVSFAWRYHGSRASFRSHVGSRTTRAWGW